MAPKKAKRAPKKLKKLSALLQRLEEKEGGALAMVLSEYRNKYKGTEHGLCHDLATALVQDVNVGEQDNEKWRWCKGSSGGVSHSWVEVDGYGIDMDDNSGTMRIWPLKNPPFQIDRDVQRSSVAETIARVLAGTV